MERLINKLYKSNKDEKVKFHTLVVQEEMQKRYYLSEEMRMDFLARISTEWSQWGIGIDFFQGIILPFATNTYIWQFLNISDGIDASSTSLNLYIVNKDDFDAKELIIMNNDKKKYKNLLDLGCDYSKININKNDFKDIHKSMELNINSKIYCMHSHCCPKCVKINYTIPINPCFFGQDLPT